MFKKILLVTMGVFWVGTTALWAQDTGTSMVAETAPEIITVEVSGPAEIPAYRWPQFEPVSDDNPACALWLKDKLSMTPREPRVAYPDNPVQTTSPGAWVNIPSLSTTVNVKPEYRSSATVMITWTMRVEGEAENINPWTENGGWCHPWHGTINESFAGGLVSSQLFVGENSQELGLPANLTLPDGGIVQSINIVDPTILGSYVIKPTDFPGNVFPATFNVQIKWRNDTCMKVVSPEGFRSMVVTIVPQGSK